MSIFGRLFKVGQASANKIVDKLEKPELMLEQAIRDQTKALGDAKKSVQAVIATAVPASSAKNTCCRPPPARNSMHSR